MDLLVGGTPSTKYGEIFATIEKLPRGLRGTDQGILIEHFFLEIRLNFRLQFLLHRLTAGLFLLQHWAKLKQDLLTKLLTA